MPSWHCKDSEQLAFPGVCFGSFSLRGCSCSPLAAVPSILRALLLLCTIRVVENFKTNICPQHIISCGCPSHEFFALLCLPSCTLLSSDHASSLPSYSLLQVSFNVETSLHCWSLSLFSFFLSPKLYGKIRSSCSSCAGWLCSVCDIPLQFVLIMPRPTSFLRLCRARFAIVSFSSALFHSDKQICPSFQMVSTDISRAAVIGLFTAVSSSDHPALLCCAPSNEKMRKPQKYSCVPSDSCLPLCINMHGCSI